MKHIETPEQFIARGGKITVVGTEQIKKVGMKKSKFNKVFLQNSVTYKRLIEHGHSPKEAKKIMKTDNYLATIACDYK